MRQSRRQSRRTISASGIASSGHTGSSSAWMISVGTATSEIT